MMDFFELRKSGNKMRINYDEAPNYLDAANEMMDKLSERGYQNIVLDDTGDGAWIYYC